MADVLEIEKVETEQNRELPKPAKDTWILKLPIEVCEREGLAEGTLISLTIKDGNIQTSFVRPPSQKIQAVAQQILSKDRKLHAELSKLGD